MTIIYQELFFEYSSPLQGDVDAEGEGCIAHVDATGGGRTSHVDPLMESGDVEKGIKRKWEMKETEKNTSTRN